MNVYEVSVPTPSLLGYGILMLYDEDGGRDLAIGYRMQGMLAMPAAGGGMGQTLPQSLRRSSLAHT